MESFEKATKTRDKVIKIPLMNMNKQLIYHRVTTCKLIQSQKQKMEKKEKGGVTPKKKKRQNLDFSTFNVQEVISDLKEKGYIGKSVFKQIMQRATQIFKYQPNVLKAESPITIVGDIHGQFYDLLNIFQRFGMPPEKNYLFLGDYIDRGMFGVEVLTLLCLLKIKYKKKILMLRGNHESYAITAAHNFLTQCKMKYNTEIFSYVVSFFQSLPLCCIVDGEYFCVHAGISPEFVSVQKFQKINRFLEIPEKGILCDMLWSDPSDEPSKKWAFNKMRSCSYFYSPEIADKFLTQNNLKLIIRGHQIQLQGFKYQESKKKKIKPTLTLFSAPNYCDKYQNMGAIGIIDKGKISILTYKEVEHPFVLPNFMSIFQWSMPYIANCATRLLLHFLSSKLKNGSKQKKKSAEQIMAEVNASEQFDFFKKVLEANEAESEKVFNEDKTGEVLGPIHNQMGNVLKFLTIKQKDNEEGFPSKEQEKVEEKNKENLFSFLDDFMKAKKKETEIIGPKIKDFVRIGKKDSE